MKILRITDKQGNFLRDDFSYDEATEIGLDVEPAQGFYKPKWDGEMWVEVATQEYIDSLKPTNEEIRVMRQEQYKLRSDSMYLAWRKYENIGETEKALTAKQMWLDEIEKINLEFPYPL